MKVRAARACTDPDVFISIIMERNRSAQKTANPLKRIQIWYALLLVVCAVFIVRLFYLQVIRHDHYQSAALAGQLKEYEIPAERGVIEAKSGDETVPIVLNEERYTLFADPVYVKSPKQIAGKLVNIIGGNRNNYEDLLKTPDTRYVVLAKKLPVSKSEKIEKLNLKGVGTREEPQRTYPQGSLAAQLLGFVNDEGQGTYGVEQALDDRLKGTPGRLKAITDAEGVPLAANKDNILLEPKPGERVTLTIDVGMQDQLENILKNGVNRAISDSGSALIIEAKTGAIKAMANFPSYDPAKFYEVDDGNLFNNGTVSWPLEVGSIMKPLTLASALDQGVVSKNTSYYDPGSWEIDDATITNVEESGGSGERTMADILRLSLNTGATWLLMQMGGGEINQKARENWHDYMKNHYHFGQQTGIEQGFEAPGSIPKPNDGFGLNIQFANSAFGQGMTATPLQMGAALASAVNGGTYYRPRLVESTVGADGKREQIKPDKLNRSVSPETSRSIQELMAEAFSNNHSSYGMETLRDEYIIGGKTGTAEIPRPEGGYYEDKFNGMFMGFVGGDEAEYVIVVRVNEPQIAGYAGTTAAGPIFVDLTNMLIDNFGVSPKS